MSGQVSRGLAGEYQADERAGCTGSSCERRVQGAVLSGQKPEREVPTEVGEAGIALGDKGWP